MKRYFLKALFLFGIMYLLTANINAFELTYSEWSEIYPEGIDEMFIEKEDRYYWYKNNIVNVEYLKLEDIQDKQYDENDIKYYTSEELLERPEEYSERIINEETKSITYTPYDVKGILLKSNSNIQISDIEIHDMNDNIINCRNDNEYLFDGDISIYYPINEGIYCYFDNKMYYKDFISFVSMKDDSNSRVTINYNLISENNDIIYYTNLSFSNKSDYTMFNSNTLMSNLHHSKKYYTYIDKLYKTYNIERENVNEYYANLDGYIKDEETKKTFYRYITNDYIIVDENDNIVTDDSHCRKNFCRLIYLVEQEENEIIENPKTYDGISKIIILLIISILILIFIVKKCHTNKKSNIVESI